MHGARLHKTSRRDEMVRDPRRDAETFWAETKVRPRRWAFCLRRDRDEMLVVSTSRDGLKTSTPKPHPCTVLQHRVVSIFSGCRSIHTNISALLKPSWAANYRPILSPSCSHNSLHAYAGRLRRQKWTKLNCNMAVQFSSFHFCRFVYTRL